MMILTYQLVDNPNYDYEVEVADKAAAARHMDQYAGVATSAELYTEEGEMVCDMDSLTWP